MSGPYGTVDALWLWELLNRKFPAGGPFRPTDEQLMTLLDELDEMKSRQKRIKF